MYSMENKSAVEHLYRALEDGHHFVGNDIYRAYKEALGMEQILINQAKHELSNTDMQLDEAFYEGVEYAEKQMYSEDRVKELLAIQRGNCYVAVLTKCKDYEVAEVAVEAPEPWNWKNNK